MPEKQRSMRLLMIALLEMVAVLGTSGAQSTPDTQLRYKVDYQCNGERVQVGHCRKDDDGLGYGPPTKPQENYCMVYYPDRLKKRWIYCAVRRVVRRRREEAASVRSAGGLCCGKVAIV